MLFSPIILALMGVGFLIAGWQGFRIPVDPDGASGLSDAELKRRRIMVRGGGYACIASGATLVLAAMVVGYAVVTILHSMPLLHHYPAPPPLHTHELGPIPPPGQRLIGVTESRHSV